MPIGPFQLGKLLGKSKKNEVLALSKDGGKALNNLGHSFITIEIRKSPADNPNIQVIVISPELENFQPLQDVYNHLIIALKEYILNNTEYWDNLNHQGEKLNLNEGNFALIRLEAFFTKDFAGVQFGVFTVPQLRGNHVTDIITRGIYNTMSTSINENLSDIISIKEEMITLNTPN